MITYLVLETKKQQPVTYRASRTSLPPTARSSTVATNIPSHRFLHVARFSSRTHSQSELLVGAGRGGHVHGIDVGVFEQIVELGVEFGHAVSLGEVLRGAFRPALWRQKGKREGGGGCTRYPFVTIYTPWLLGLTPEASHPYKAGMKSAGFSPDQARNAPSAKRREAVDKTREG